MTHRPLQGNSHGNGRSFFLSQVKDNMKPSQVRIEGNNTKVMGKFVDVTVGTLSGAEGPDAYFGGVTWLLWVNSLMHADPDLT